MMSDSLIIILGYLSYILLLIILLNFNDTIVPTCKTIVRKIRSHINPLPQVKTQIADTSSQYLTQAMLLSKNIQGLHTITGQSQRKLIQLALPIQNENDESQAFIYEIYLEKLQALKAETAQHMNVYQQYKNAFYTLIKHSPDQAQYDDTAIALDDGFQALQMLRKGIGDALAQIQQKQVQLEIQQLENAYQELVQPFKNEASLLSIWASYDLSEEASFWKDYEGLVTQMRKLRRATIQMAS